ncbi:MAG: ABC transporter substrate-binding protein [Bacilli bacterium]|nr:ABC transporter substrate-binding protein [Bacilli bacterium]
MKKFLGLMLALVMMVVVTGCGSSSDSKDNSLEKIKEAGVIKIGTNSGYPPYEFYDTSNNQKKLVGYDVDLGNAIAEKLGVKVEWVDIDFDALIGSLQSGKFDIILAGMVDTPEREKSIDFSDPYYQSQTVAVVKKADVANYKDASQYKGKTIVVQSGTTQDDTAKAVTGAKVLELPGVTDSIASLTSGKADALFIAEVSAKNIVAQYPEYTYTTIKGIDDALLNDGASIGLPKGETALKDELNSIIKELKDSGELDKMFNENVALYDKLN